MVAARIGARSESIYTQTPVTRVLVNQKGEATYVIQALVDGCQAIQKVNP
jgi:hypothetical protein